MFVGVRTCRTTRAPINSRGTPAWVRRQSAEFSSPQKRTGRRSQVPSCELLVLRYVVPTHQTLKQSYIGGPVCASQGGPGTPKAASRELATWRPRAYRGREPTRPPIVTDTPSFSRLQAALADTYRIEREIGHGGMATVYLAHDIKHDREVAVKVLRPDLAATLGPDRFLREVRIAASLTHPHILGLHDSGEADGFLYYVMPYIEGESLRERIARQGDLPVPEAVRIIKEVVDALAYAHSQNVVHRDIKPDNVLLSGRHAMVTDFGVAKAVSEATGRDKLTTAGVALGTPTYMAPEQAAADPHIDHRADIYAIGVVAYELLAGEPPFTGTTQQQILAAHLSQAPQPVSQRRANISPTLDQFVMKCLEKRPSDRWQSADEMLPMLESLATPSGGVTPTGTMPVNALKRPLSASRVAVLSGAVVGLAILGFLGWSSLRHNEPAITVSNTRQVTRGAEVEIDPAISPNGSEVAYTLWTGPEAQVLVRDLEGGRPIAVAAEPGVVAQRPRWTPDGRSIVFTEGGRASLVPRFGGPARTVAAGVVWDVRAGFMASVRGDSILVGPMDGGQPGLVTRVDNPYSLALSPDGERLAYVTGNHWYVSFGNLGSVAPSMIWVVGVDGGEPVAVTDNASLNTGPAWLPDGRHLLFISNRDGPRDVYVQRLDGSGRASGAPVRVTTGLEPYSISVSADGTKAAYARFLFRRNLYAVRIPASGSVSIKAARAITSGNQIVEGHGLSPDGKWLAFDANLEGHLDIYVTSVNGGEPRRLTTDPSDDMEPEYSRDGTQIVFYSTRSGTRDIFLMDANGGNVQRLTDQPGQEYHPSFSPDGQHIAYDYAEGGQVWLYMVSRDSVTGSWGAPQRVATTGSITDLHWSPDGRHVLQGAPGGLTAFALDGTKRVVVPFGAGGLMGASMVGFSPNGRFMYFHASTLNGDGGLYQAAPDGSHPRLVIRYDDPSRPVWSTVSVGNGVAYFSIAEFESDVYAMDLEIH